MKVTLTDRRLKTLKGGEDYLDVWDAAVPGFGVRVAPSGRKTFVLMARWPEQGRTVIAVLHDLDLVRRLCPQSLVMARQAVAWGPTRAAISPEQLTRARKLAESWNVSDEPPVSVHDREHA